MNLLDIIAKNSRIYPDETAFVEVRPVTKARKEISWRRFEERVNRIANALREMGVNPGDRVLLFGRNSIHWLEVYFGVLKTGAWIAPLNYRFTNEDIAYCANVSQPVGLLLRRRVCGKNDALSAKTYLPSENMSP